MSVHIITTREFASPGTGSSSVETICTCGEVMVTSARAAEQAYSEHILAAIRADRAADKSAGHIIQAVTF